MKNETLESLLCDRALGELTPQVNELLAAYLAQNPSAATRSQKIETATALARQAVALPAAVALPKADPVWREQGSRRRWFPPLRVGWMQLAATLIVGAGVGWFAAGWRVAPSSSASSPVVASIAAAAHTVRPDSSARGSFWTVPPPGTGASPAPASSSGRYRLVWESPLKKPTIEETP